MSAPESSIVVDRDPSIPAELQTDAPEGGTEKIVHADFFNGNKFISRSCQQFTHVQGSIRQTLT